ncbi:MAG: CAP domain-containing protein [Deltaproteobacteria bacterium]|nr:CAP domain-containing protein [Deltaproteobacteria bacterium]
MLRRGRLIRVLCFAAALAAARCGAAPSATPARPEPSYAGTRKASSWTEAYGGPAPELVLTLEEQDLWARVLRDVARPCSADSRLTEAARQQALALSKSSVSFEDGGLDRLRFNLLRLGSTDYAVAPLVAVLDTGGREALGRLAARRASEWTHCGLGVGGNKERRVAVFAGVRRVVELDAFPVRSEPGSRLLVRGRVVADADAPLEPYLGLPDGSVQRLPAVRVSDRRFAFEVPLESKGRHDLEVLVDTGRGYETAALVPLFVGVAPDERPVIVADDVDAAPAGDPEAALGRLIDGARRRAGLHPLERDARLDEAAKAHCRDMVANRFFGHVSPSRGPLALRLSSLGLSPFRMAENVARSGSVTRLHHNLMESPSHRVNIVDPAFTHMGLGVGRDGNDLVATEIFVRWEASP